MKHMKFKLFLILCYILGVGISYYIMLPPLHIHAIETYFYFIPVLGIGYLLLLYLISGTKISLQGKLARSLSYPLIVLGIIVASSFVLNIYHSRLFQASSYVARINLEPTEFSSISEVDFSKTPIIDRNSTLKLGDRAMGNIPELVSQFEVSEEYTEISYKESVYRVTPLEYADIIKYFTNRKSGIPAYITVDSTNGNVELVKLSSLGLDGMKYVPSAMFNENLLRKLRFSHPFEIFGAPSFEIDEEGNPWYICTTYTYSGIGVRKRVTGAIFLDPITGKSTKYDMEDIPAWADRIVPAELAMEEIHDNGSLQGGYWNRMFSQKNVTVPSNGYNYIEQDGDIWVYTGITSANKDASNLGFALVNLRTHEGMRISSPGADESSAMSSAEGEVLNFGYHATFPLLVNVGNKPTYFLSLKDDSGLVKMNAMVDATDYQKIATISSEESKEELKKKMLALQGTQDIPSEETTTKDVTISNLRFAVYDNQTTVYFSDQDQLKYKVAFNSNNETILAFIENGQTYQITYIPSDTLNTITNIKK